MHIKSWKDNSHREKRSHLQYVKCVVKHVTHLKKNKKTKMTDVLGFNWWKMYPSVQNCREHFKKHTPKKDLNFNYPTSPKRKPSMFLTFLVWECIS